MNFMKQFSGCWDTQKKNKVFDVFFLFCIAKKAEFASFFFIRFINLNMRSVLAVSGCNLMNYMKDYEGVVLMANFRNVVFWVVFFNLLQPIYEVVNFMQLHKPS